MIRVVRLICQWRTARPLTPHTAYHRQFQIPPWRPLTHAFITHYLRLRACADGRLGHRCNNCSGRALARSRSAARR